MRNSLLILAVAVFTCALMGCGESVPPPSEKTQKESSRLQDIKQKSGGDWNKLTPEDKDYLVKTLAQGSESTARMLLGAPQRKAPPVGGGSK